MFADLPLFFINRLLASETWASDLLRPHAGQTAVLELGGFSLRFTVSAEARLHAAAAEASETVSIRVPAEALPDLLDGPENLTRHAHIEGNAAFAETLARLLRHLRPDLAAWLAPQLGDVLATRVARGAHSVGSTALNAGRKLGDATLSLLRDETGVLVSQAEHDAFQQDLADLSAGIEALQKRIAHLTGDKRPQA